MKGFRLFGARHFNRSSRWQPYPRLWKISDRNDLPLCKAGSRIQFLLQAFRKLCGWLLLPRSLCLLRIMKIWANQFATRALFSIFLMDQYTPLSFTEFLESNFDPSLRRHLLWFLQTSSNSHSWQWQLPDNRTIANILQSNLRLWWFGCSFLLI